MTTFGGTLTQLPLWDVLLRLSLAVLLGGILGLDRELKGTDAGLKTHAMIALAAAIFTVLTFEIYYATDGPNRTRSDPIRIVEAVTAGVAFLAAGAIIVGKGEVRGLTTGAGMWLAGAIGLACGAGFYSVAAIGVVLALFVYRGLMLFEHYVLGVTKPSQEELREEQSKRPEREKTR